MGQVNWRLQATGAPGPWETYTSAPSTRPLWNWNLRPPQLLRALLCTSVPAPNQWRWLELCPTSAPAFSRTEVPASCPYRAHLKGQGRKTTCLLCRSAILLIGSWRNPLRVMPGGPAPHTGPSRASVRKEATARPLAPAHSNFTFQARTQAQHSRSCALHSEVTLEHCRD